MMISLEALKDTPTAGDYLAENKAFLVKQKAESSRAIRRID